MSSLEVSTTLGRYCRQLILVKINEFVLCFLLFAALIYLFPEPPYYYYTEKVDIESALRGGLLTTSLFFLITAYPLVSFAVVIAVVILFRPVRRTVLAAVETLFSMIYVALWIVALGLSYPPSFWVVWFLTGLMIFFLGLALFPDPVRPKGKEQ